MSAERILISTLIMAGVTYLIRMLPLGVFKRKITNRFVRSFLAYVPYAVLAAMTFPAILYSTANVYSAAVGLLAALLLAYWGKGLLTVAVGSAAAVFLTEQIMRTLGLA